MLKIILFITMASLLIIVNPVYAQSFQCTPNSFRGDINGDGIVNQTDIQIAIDMAIGQTQPPSDMCCVDINNDGIIRIDDVQGISNIFSQSKPLRRCNQPYSSTYSCSPSSFIGDINGDNIIDLVDVNIAVDMGLGKIPKPPNICCIDPDNNGEVNVNDAQWIASIASQSISGQLKNITICVDTNLEIGIATTKKLYRVGEMVTLTDPPLEEGSSENKEGEEKSLIPFNESAIGETKKEPSSISKNENSEREATQKTEGKETKQEQETKQETSKKLEKFVESLDIKSLLSEKSENKLIPIIIEFKKSPLGLKNPSEKGEYNRALIAEHTAFKNKIVELSGPKNFKDFYVTYNGIATALNLKEIASVLSWSEIKGIFIDKEVEVTLSDSVPLIQANMIHELDSDGNLCTKSTKPCLRGDGVVVAVIDTGIDYSHPDLGGCLGANCKVIGGFNFVGNNSDPMDDQGHGTHVAGIIAGTGKQSNKYFGVAPNAKLIGYKVMDKNGRGYTSDIIQGIERSVDPNQDGDYKDHVDVISMSLGGGNDPTDPIVVSTNRAVEMDAVVVVSAGNSGPGRNTILCPGCAENAITVGASTHRAGSRDSGFEKVSWFSSRGVLTSDFIKPEVVAPGGDVCKSQGCSIEAGNRYEYGIISTRSLNVKRSPTTLCTHLYQGDCLDFLYAVQSDYIKLSGTSMSAPHVSGVVALIKQAHPDWTPDEIKSAITSTAISLGEDIYTEGYGRVDALKAISLKSPPPVVKLKIGQKIVNGGNVFIIGNISTKNFRDYILEYSPINSNTWTPLASSATPVRNINYPWNVDNIKSGEYLLKLTVYDTNNQKGYAFAPLIIDHDLKNGWPYTIRGSSWLLGSMLPDDFHSPKIADINDDGIKDIVVNSLYGVYAFNGNGVVYPNWPRIVFNVTDPFNPNGLFLTTSVAVGNVNADTTLEMIASGPTLLGYTLLNYMYNNRGETLVGWPVSVGDTDIVGTSLPIIKDIDNSGRPEIILSDQYRIFVYSENGSLVQSIGLWQGPVVIGGLMKQMPPPLPQNVFTLVEDIDKDGYSEIIALRFGSSTSTTAYSIEIFNNKGNLLNEYIYTRNFTKQDNVGSILHTLANPPVIGNLDGYGNPELVFITRDTVQILTNLTGNMTQLNGWPLNLSMSNNSIESSPALADLDGDFSPEIVLVINDVSAKEMGIYVFRGDGTIFPGWPKKIPYSQSSNNPVVGNIDDDTEQEILIADSNGKIFAFNHDGTLVYGWPKHTGALSVQTTPAIGDVDGDGLSEVVAAAGNMLFVYDTPATEEDNEWSQYQNSPYNSGKYKGKPFVKSMINNTGNTSISGQLILKAQKKINHGWVDERIVVNKNITINPNSFIALDTEWFNWGGFVAIRKGEYRVFADFKTPRGNFTKYYDFRAI